VRIVITAVGQRTEHWTDLFALLAARADVEVTFVLADVSPQTELTMGELDHRFPNLRHVVTRHLLSERRSGHMASVMFAPGGLRAAVPERPDLIHVIGEAAYLSTRQVIRWRDRCWPDVPISLYAAQNVVIDFPFPFPGLERRAYAAIDHALPITPTALEVLRTKGYRGPATVVPLGVDTTVFSPADPVPPHPFTVGFVGRLEPHKGIADLLAAAETLDCRLLLVGRGSLSPMVEAAVRRRPDRVRLVGWLDHEELPGVVRQMDVLTLPSAEIVQHNVLPWIGIPLREQFGRSLVEAMACGVPVVGSDVGEIAFVIGDAGLVYPEGDVGALTAALAQIRDDPELAHRLGRTGYRRARTEFGWSGTASRLLAVWSRLAAERRGTAGPPAAPEPVAHASRNAIQQPPTTTTTRK
jgi:glycosyltransferase involved in cell wall biosynthesis